MKAPKQTAEHKLAKLKRLEELRRNYALFFYKPYERQRQFHNAGQQYRERLLMAGNKLGKTFAAGFEMAFHATGIYPDWWQGFRFKKQNRWWAGSVTSELTRDGMQRILLGPIGRWGTGCIPKELIIDIKRARGVPDAVETILVRHTNGDVSQITFKAYSDGREAWQAEDLDGVWFDEEPPYDIYIEGVTRTNNSGGPVFMTFTPLMGMTSTVLRFPIRPRESHPDRSVTNMTIDDVEHYSDEQKRRILDSYPAHEREARAMGIPMLGSGRIFPVAEEVIVESPLSVIPAHWKQIIGLDFGWDHPTAAVRLVYDEEVDCIHIVNNYRQSEAIPLIHASAIKPWGEWIPVAWPHDGYQHDKGSGDQLANQYRSNGLKMLSENAKFGDDRGNGVEAGISEMLERMQTGRWKVDANCSLWLEEFRMYHRKDGKIIKTADDVLCASRYALMDLRYAIPESYAPKRRDKYDRSYYHGNGGTTWMAS
jgi:phage terminase large subunit-like protein